MIVGQKVRIKYNEDWNGIYSITKIYSNKSVQIIHPIHGAGAFYSAEYEVIPLTKLELALK